MTAADELRALLDERGVERELGIPSGYRDSEGQIFDRGDGFC